MSRIGTLKPEIFRQEELFDAEQRSQLPLRAALLGLFTYCDREGRFRWQPRRLKSYVLPYDDVDMAQVLEALKTLNWVQPYEHQGERYGYIPAWSHCQYVSRHEPPSELPAPPEPRTRNHSAIERTEPCAERKLATSISFKNEPEGTQPACVSEMPSTQDLVDIHRVFEHWRVVMQHPQAKLDVKRKALIKKALQCGYDIQQLCEAITGCSYTPHNMGLNDRGQRYDGLHIILRDADQIDRFIHYYHYPPHPLTEAEQRTQLNVRALTRWAEQKRREPGFNEQNSPSEERIHVEHE